MNSEGPYIELVKTSTNNSHRQGDTCAEMSENTPSEMKFSESNSINEANEENYDSTSVSDISMQVHNGTTQQNLSESFIMVKEDPKENNVQNSLSTQCTAMDQDTGNNTEVVLATSVSLDAGQDINSSPENKTTTNLVTRNGHSNRENDSRSIEENVTESKPMILDDSRNSIESMGISHVVHISQNKVTNCSNERICETPVCTASTCHIDSSPLKAPTESEKDMENISSSCTEGGTNIKVEKKVGKVEFQQRVQSIVDYSDDEDDNDADGSSSFVPPFEDRQKEFEGELSDEEDERKSVTVKPNMQKNKIRTEGEVFPEELPPLEYLIISPDESVELEPLGVVSGIVDVLVVIKADNNSPALYDDTILFVEGRKQLGLIFETFGTVERPYYSVRFNTAQDIAEKGIEVGHRVYFAPKADNLTKYVFIAELRKIKCDDASWKNDNECPPSQRDYSDDEEERKEKRRAKNKERGITDSDASHGNSTQRKKKKRPGQDARQDTQPNRSSLLSGDLMRNPFGDKPTNRNFKAGSANGWSGSRPANNSNPTGPRVGGPLSVPPPSPAPHMFHPPPIRLRPGPPAPSFGQSPRWSPRFNTQPLFNQTSSPGPNYPPPVGQPPFPFTAASPLPPSGRPPFEGCNMPSFSTPCPPPFHPGNQLPNLNSPSNLQQRPPSFSTRFPPPPPTSFFGLRPARFNFNPSLPPPPLFSGMSPSLEQLPLPTGKQPHSNGNQKFASNSHAYK